MARPLGKRQSEEARMKMRGKRSSMNGNDFARKKHWAPKGMSTHPLFNIYFRMVSKHISNPDIERWNVDKRWMEGEGQGFVNFLFDMGERPEGAFFGRRDSTKPYEKCNCLWMTQVDRTAYETLERLKDYGQFL